MILDDIEIITSKNIVEYSQAISFMEDRVLNIINNNAKSLIWITEHNPIYTAGVSAKKEDLLKISDIPIYNTNRGGKYTYHGPGMKIIYVMFDLKKLFSPKKPDISIFVEFLEKWIIEFLREFNINGEIRKGRVGIWVDQNGSDKKIAAIGIKIKKWVSYHGIAININPDLEPFENIVPCGIKEFGITSLKNLNIKYNHDQLNDILIKSFNNEFSNLRKACSDN